MDPGGQAREGSRGEKVGDYGDTSVGDAQGWDCAGGDSLGKYGPPPDREGGVQGHGYIRGFVEGVLSCG